MSKETIYTVIVSDNEYAENVDVVKISSDKDAATVLKAVASRYIYDNEMERENIPEGYTVEKEKIIIQYEDYHACIRLGHISDDVQTLTDAEISAAQVFSKDSVYNDTTIYDKVRKHFE